jgi:hypothetical protein
MLNSFLHSTLRSDHTIALSLGMASSSLSAWLAAAIQPFGKYSTDQVAQTLDTLQDNLKRVMPAEATSGTKQ